MELGRAGEKRKEKGKKGVGWLETFSPKEFLKKKLKFKLFLGLNEILN
jgi:hypothetical protein